MMNELHQSQLRPFEEELASRAADARGKLSKNDERILAHLHDNLDELPFHTSDSLGRSVGVSRAAVVRFAAKLGYSGFTEMQRASRAALREAQESPLSRFSGRTDSLLEQKALQDSRNVLSTEALIRDSIGAAARSIAEADRVFLLGALKSGGLIVHMHRLLAGVRSQVHLVDPAFPDEIADVEKGDVVIACLFRRYARVTVELLGIARRSGAHTVLITDGRGHDFAAAAEVIVASTHSPTLYDSMIGPLFALEALAAEVAAVDPARSKARLKDIEDFTGDRRLLLG